MIEQVLAIIRNTFFESIRQPIVLVVVVTASLLIMLCNPLSAFTMEDDQRMLIDIGMATVFAAGTILAAFVATNVIGNEIKNRTALTVISKPVGRPLFVLGKFIGVALALMVCSLALLLVFLLVELHGVRQRAMDPYHVPVWTFSVFAVIAGFGIAVWCNYFYGKVFASTALCVTTPLLAIAYVMSMMFNADFEAQPIAASIRPQIWMGGICVVVAILVLTSIAVAASTRLGQLMTLVITLGMFMLGMLSDWFFGRRIRNLEQTWLARAEEAGQTETVEVVRAIELVTGEKVTATETIQQSLEPLRSFAEAGETAQYALYTVGYAALPNFQLLWLSDALTQGHVIPVTYVLQAIGYGVLYITVALSAGVILFQTREVG
jgi:ABC-2 type transport system permease protein